MKELKIYSETFLVSAIIALLTIAAAVFIGKFLQRKIEQKIKGHQIDITGFVFLKHLVVATIYFLGFGWALLLLPITHTFAHSMLAGAGVSTLILGFASQQLLSNLLSGVLLVVRRPFKIGDSIEFQSVSGKVTGINLHSVLIEDSDGNEIIIPSSSILNNNIKIIKQEKEK